MGFVHGFTRMPPFFSVRATSCGNGVARTVGLFFFVDLFFFGFLAFFFGDDDFHALSAIGNGDNVADVDFAGDETEFLERPDGGEAV